MAKWRTCPRESLTPATPAKTVSKSTSAAESERIWARVLEAGAEFGIKPCGSARATRCVWKPRWCFTARIDASISPLEADLAWIAKLDKGEFVGREALRRQKEVGLRRRLTGFEMTSRPIARDGYECT